MPRNLYSWKTIIPLCLLLPPLGLVLIWMRPATTLSRKILGSVYIFFLVTFYLYYFFGLRAELDGSGSRLLLSFHRRGEAQYAALEANRVEHSTFPQGKATTPISSPVAVESDPHQVRVREDISSSPKAELTEVAVLPRNPAYWTDFRGPERDGHYAETEILTTWPAQGLELLWKQPVGGGYASFVAADGLAFTIEQRRNQEVTAAYDIETGQEIWAQRWSAEFRESMGGDGPRATPTWNKGRIYSLGALGELRCMEAKTGQLIWRTNILADNEAQNLQWGMSAAPLVVDDKVIVLPGGRSGKSVAAYDKMTGQPRWKVLDDKQAYTSPMLVTLAGRRQILVVSAQRAMGLDVSQGTLLWDFPWITNSDVNSAQPVIVSDNRLLLSAGYGHGAALIEVTEQAGHFTAEAIWQNLNLKNKFNSSVFYEGHIYGLDEAILTCVDASTGDRNWKGGRYGYGQLLLASGHLIILTESGEVVLVKANPTQHIEVARFSAIEGKTWNHPALASGRLLVRNSLEMACFNIAGK